LKRLKTSVKYLALFECFILAVPHMNDSIDIVWSDKIN
jgi:hypothetical protein